MKIRDILRHKGRDVVTASKGDSVLHAVRVLVDHNIGGVVVVDGEEVIGMLTERDILRLVASKPDELQAIDRHADGLVSVRCLEAYVARYGHVPRSNGRAADGVGSFIDPPVGV